MTCPVTAFATPPLLVAPALRDGAIAAHPPIALSLAAFVIAAGLVGGSFKIVEPLEYALLQNTISREVTSGRVYTSGRFFVGLARDFIRYPRVRRNVFFGTGSEADSPSLSVQLTEGQVQFDLGFQYSLNASSLITLFRSFGINYHTRFVAAAASAVPASVSTGVNVSDFYANRARVTSLAFNAVRNALSPLGATVHDLQIRQVTLPTQVETQIVGTMVANQRARTASNEQVQRQINAQITVVVGQINQEIDLFQSNQTQSANIITTRTAATSKQLQLDSASQAYTAFGSVLGFNTTELLQYLYLRNTRNLPDPATVSVGFTTNTLWAP